MKKLIGKVAIVTASSRGIGFESAKLLAENVAIVYIAGFEEEDAVENILKSGGNAKFVYFNAKEEESYAKMIDTVYENEGRIDILVNNYGATDVKLDRNVVEGDSEAFLNILKNGGGSIVNISSIGSIVPDLSRTAYCVSKAAINSLTENIALQYAKQNIRCNAVLPGLIATKAALQNISHDFRKSFLKHVPLNRVGTP